MKKSHNSVGIPIPKECSNILIFSDKKTFEGIVNNGNIIPLYGMSKAEKEFIPNVYIGYVNPNYIPDQK